jgi:hypothetical protein
VAAHVWIVTTGIHGVVVPFGKRLGEMADTSDPRMHRDLPHFIGLVKAHALLCPIGRGKPSDGKVFGNPNGNFDLSIRR